MSKKKPASAARLLHALASAHERFEDTLDQVNDQAREILDAVCEQLGESRARLARLADINPTHLEKVVSGDRPGGIKLWLKIHDLLEQESKGKGA